MPKESFTIEQVVTLLAQSPLRIAMMVEGIDPALLRTAPAPGEWSANEILAHLRACADVWGGCINEILDHEDPVLKAVNPRTWIKSTNYLSLEFQPSLQTFALQRTELVEKLQRLQQVNWSKSARVTGAGAPLQRSVYFYAQWIVRHERPHLKQIAQTAKTLQIQHQR